MVPLVIGGSRRLLRDQQWMFRRSAITVRALPAITSDAQGFSAAVRLRDAVRAAMLEETTEPDLAVPRVTGEASARRDDDGILPLDLECIEE